MPLDDVQALCVGVHEPVASKVYVGLRTSGSEGVTVSVLEGGDPRPLPPRFDLRSHSPTGFGWGHSGRGPAQLALAILADITGNDEYAVRHHHWLKLEVIAALPWEGWKLTKSQIEEWIQQHHPLDAQG